MSYDEHVHLIHRTDQALQELERDEVERLQKAYDASYLALERELLNKYPQYGADSQQGLLATQRAMLLQDELQALLPLMKPGEQAAYEARYKRLLGTASQQGTTLGMELTRLQAGDDFVKSSATVPIEAVAASARDTVKRLYRYDRQFQDEASVIIGQGLMQGWGGRRVASQLRQRLGVTKSNAERIARTEIISSQDTATRQFYQANGIDQYIRIATEDTRVCGYCAERAGQVYPAEVPVSLHPNDRCYAAPWIPEYEETNPEFQEWAKLHQAAAMAKATTAATGMAPFERMNAKSLGRATSNGLQAIAKPTWTPDLGYIEGTAFYTQLEQVATGALLSNGLVQAIVVYGATKTALNIALPSVMAEALQIAATVSATNAAATVTATVTAAAGEAASAWVAFVAKEAAKRAAIQLAQNILVGVASSAATAGISAGGAVVNWVRYRDNLPKSAEKAEVMADEIKTKKVPEDAEAVNLVAGAFASKEGRSGAFFGRQWKPVFEDMNMATFGVNNPEFDTTVDYSKSPAHYLAWVGNAIGVTLEKHVVMGYNPEAIKMAATAIKYHRETGLPINLVGYSGGGLIVAEAHELLRIAGVPTKSVTYGTPWFGYTVLPMEDHIQYVGDGDMIANLSPVRSPNARVLKGVVNHNLDNYVGRPDGLFPTLEMFKRNRKRRKGELKPEPVEPPQITNKSLDESRSKEATDLWGQRPIRQPEPVPGIEALEHRFKHELKAILRGQMPLLPGYDDIPMVNRTRQLIHLFEDDIRALYRDRGLLLPPGKDLAQIAGMRELGLKFRHKLLQLTRKQPLLALPPGKEDTKTQNQAQQLLDTFKDDLTKLARPQELLALPASPYPKELPDHGGLLRQLEGDIRKLYRDRTLLLAPAKDLPKPANDLINRFRDTLIDSYRQMETKALPAGFELPNQNRVEQLFNRFRGDVLNLYRKRELLLPPALSTGKDNPTLTDPARDLMQRFEWDLAELYKPREPLKLAPAKQPLDLPQADALADNWAGELQALNPNQMKLARLELDIPESITGEGTPRIQDRSRREIYEYAKQWEREQSRKAEFELQAHLRKIQQSDLAPTEKLRLYRESVRNAIAETQRVETLTPPNGTKSADFTAFEFGGVTWHIEGEPNARHLDAIRKYVELGLPEELTRHSRSVFFTKQNNDSEAYYRARLGLREGAQVKAASRFEDGAVTLYGGNTDSKELLRQMGYQLAYNRYGQLTPPPGSEFALAQQSANPTTPYGLNGADHDFAYSVKEFFTDPSHLQRMAPERYEAISRMVNFRHPTDAGGLPMGGVDTRSPQILFETRIRNQEVLKQIQLAQKESERVVAKQFDTKRMASLTDRHNASRYRAEAEQMQAQNRTEALQAESLRREVAGLEQRSLQLFNPLNEPYFSQAPRDIDRTRAAINRTRRRLEQIRDSDKTISAAQNSLDTLKVNLATLGNRKDSQKVARQIESAKDSILQLLGDAEAAQGELGSLPRSQERSDAIREIQRLRRAVNDYDVESPLDLQRQRLAPQIDELESMLTSLRQSRESAVERLGSLDELESRLDQLPTKLGDINRRDRQRYRSTQEIRRDIGSLPERLDRYRELRNNYRGQVDQRVRRVTDIAQQYDESLLNAIRTNQALFEGRLSKIRDNLSILESLDQRSIAWLYEERNWESGDPPPNDLGLVLPGQGDPRDRYRAAQQEITDRIEQANGAIQRILDQLDYPRRVAATQTNEAIAQLDEFERIIDEVENHRDRASNRVIRDRLKQPERTRARDVVGAGIGLENDLERFNRNVAKALLENEDIDPDVIRGQYEMFTAARDNLADEVAAANGEIIRQVREAQELAEIVRDEGLKDQERELTYDVGNVAYTETELREMAEEYRGRLRSLLQLSQVNIEAMPDSATQARLQREAQQSQRNLEMRSQIDALRRRLGDVNQQIRKRQEAAARGQKRGIATGALEAEQANILDQINELARQFNAENE